MFGRYGFGYPNTGGGDLLAFQNRVIADGGEMILDAGEIAALMPLGDWSWFYVPAGRKAGVSYAQIPGSAGDLTMTRASVANAIARNGNLTEVAANVGRLDFLNGAFLGQPIEPLATNLALRSEEFDNAVWIKTNATITPNSQTAPNGTLTADTLTATANGGQVQLAITGTSGIAYTTSFYIRRRTGSGVVNIRSVENVNTPITVTNNWTRVSLTTTSTTTTIRIGISLNVSGDEVDIWGAQLETGSVATSYIRTEGTTATRQADVFTRTGASGLIGSGALTLYAEINSRLTGGANAKRILTLSDGTANNVVSLEKTSTDAIRALVINGGVEQMSVISGTSPTGNIKVAAGIGTDDGVLFVNGTQIGTDTSLTIPSGLNRIDYGQSSLGALHLNDRGRAAGISQRRWTNAELENLTRL